ncbi:unnamed protein product, partial [Musa banksii]
LPPIAPEAIHSWAKLSTSPQASVSSSPSCGDGFAMGLCSSATYHGPMLRGLEPDSVGDEIVDVPLRYEESAASKTPNQHAGEAFSLSACHSLRCLNWDEVVESYL